jgi:thymidylate synthase ThyX
MIYPAETFTDEESRRLEPHFTNLDRPVFALVNLPETVKGALFARYSRYPGTLRRLFLDEFADSLPELPASFEGDEGRRAAELYERVFLEYGDDSVAQLGGAHVACEWTSNVLTKLLQRPRLASYLEQSTRYIAYDKPMGGHAGGGFRYYRDASLGPSYAAAMDRLFTIYSESLPKVREWVASTFPAPAPGGEGAHRRAVNAKALDLLRGLLPAASLSHMGIFASGQAYEQMVLHLLAHPLPEARSYGEMILTELEAVMPSFLARVRRPERGGRWMEQLAERSARAVAAAERLGLRGEPAAAAASVRLVAVDGDERRLAAALLTEESTVSEAEIEAAIDRVSPVEVADLVADLVGARENRRHRPGRGLEAVKYRFEVVSDYGAFRDLQRHRLLTVQWQELTPRLGADIPEEVGLAGCGGAYREALDVSTQAWERLREERGGGPACQYALCLAFRLRYTMDMNAREAMHLIELRSGDQGHPSYRAVAQEMHRLIAEVHPSIAAAMQHVDLTTEPRLERLLAEMRTQAKREALEAGRR